jgi:glycerol uptake facilitator-like aquaporin
VSTPSGRQLVATAFLLAAIVGSGIMGERLADGNVAVALLANSIATGGALLALIATFQPISGAHLNPVVTLVDAWEGGLPCAGVRPADVEGFVLAQLAVGAAAVPLIRWLLAEHEPTRDEAYMREHCSVGNESIETRPPNDLNMCFSARATRRARSSRRCWRTT